MARERFDRGFYPTAPDDIKDPPRFGQIIETTKDCLVVELRKFIDSTRRSAERRIEVPTIDKYSTNASLSPYETVARVQRRHADLKEALPHIAVLSTTTSELKLSIGTPYLGTVQSPPQIQTTQIEPFALQDGDILVVRTRPAKADVISHLVFKADRFPDAHPISAALAVDVARVINEQALYVKATAQDDGSIIIACGGLEGSTGPNEVEVLADTSEGVIAALGLGRSDLASGITKGAGVATLTASAGTFNTADVGCFVQITDAASPFRNVGRFKIESVAVDGSELVYAHPYAKTVGGPVAWTISLTDNSLNPARPPRHRFAYAADNQVQIDIIADDENERDELTDLVYSFFAFFLEQQYFTFWGRSFFDPAIPNEWYQIIMKSSARAGGETEIPREGDPNDKIYVSSIGIDVTTVMYLDREVLKPGSTDPWITGSDDFTPDEDIAPPT